MATAVIISVLVVYLLISILIGHWAQDESTDVAGYFLAGKRLPSWVIAFSANATGESAWLLLGLTGMGYLVGIHAFWVVLGEVLGIALAWAFIARPVKAYSDKYDSITVPDLLEDRFRDRRQILRRIGAVVILTMVATYTAAQLTATGKAFESFLSLDYTTGVVIGSVVIIYYTVIGGFKAVAYNDFFHGLLMFLALLVLPIIGIVAAGGWSEVMTSLNATDPSLLRPMGELGISIPGIASAASFAAVGLAFLAVPQLVTRFMSARTVNEAAPAGLISVVCLIVFDVGAVLTGMSGRVLFPGLPDSEAIMPLMSTELFPALFTGILMVVVLSAIMSTADSLLILASSVVVRDIVQKIYNPVISERRLSFLGKLTVVVLGAAAVGVALMEARVIFWFVLFAWSGLAGAFLPVILCGMYWHRTTLAGAVAGMTTGFITTVGWVLFFKEQVLDLYEMIPGVFVGLGVTIVVSLFTQPPEGAEEEFREIHDALGHPFRRKKVQGVPEGKLKSASAAVGDT